MSDRFAEIVGGATIRAGGRVVKLLGDGAMLHFPNANDAVRGSLELLDRIPAAGLPPAHAGVNAGPVVFRDGDYYGRTVNVAARVADHASAGELLVTEEAVPVPAADDLEFEPVADASLKGLSGTLKLYRVRRTEAA
jgi:adenylate cyclase